VLIDIKAENTKNDLGGEWTMGSEPFPKKLSTKPRRNNCLIAAMYHLPLIIQYLLRGDLFAGL
jgi:hypothetical protein